VRCCCDPQGAKYLEWQASTLCAVHGLRQKGRDDPASGLGRNDVGFLPFLVEKLAAHWAFAT
jgi:hypothetical protein